MGGISDKTGAGYNEHDSSEDGANSHAAAKESLRRKIHKALLEHQNGLADWELRQITGEEFAGQRRSDLKRQSLVREVLGVKRRNPKSGVGAKVWSAYDDDGNRLSP